MRNNLKDIFQIQKVLESNGYYDISRISNEVLEYSLNNRISLESIFEEIGSGKPWEYVRGKAEFCNNLFFVNKDTLIPRIETEQIVEIVKGLLNDKDIEYKDIVDIGTGSGCIIISLAKIFQSRNEIRFIGTDISEKPLKVARKNSLLHKVDNKVLFSRSNLIEEIDLDKNTLIVANLPYIPTPMYEKLDNSVKNFEPKIALDGGEDGLRYYKMLLEQIKNKIKDKPEISITLIIEIEPSTLPSLIDVISTRYKVIKDCKEKKRFVLIHFP